MHLYRFFNPSAVGADKCVVIVAATSVEALCAYVDRYHPNNKGYVLYREFHYKNFVVMQVSLKKLSDGVVIFHNLFSIDIR